MLIVEKSNAFTNRYLGILLILAFPPNSIEVVSLSVFTLNAGGQWQPGLPLAVKKLNS